MTLLDPRLTVVHKYNVDWERYGDNPSAGHGHHSTAPTLVELEVKSLTGFELE